MGQRGSERRKSQTSEPQAWFPALMLNGDPLRDNASIRDFHGGDGCLMALTLEEALLLLNDMAELRSIRRHEVFLNLKRYLGMVCTPFSLFFFFFFLFFVFTSLWLFVRLPTPLLSSYPSCF